MSRTQCRVKECKEPVKAREWCQRHYARWRNHGTTAGGSGLKREQTLSGGWTDVELAWVAGILEGEGSFYVGPGGRKLTVEMKDLDIIERVQTILGGGRMHHRTGGIHAGMHALTIARCRDLVVLLPAIMPWLGERRQAQANKLLDECVEAAKLDP